MVQLTKIKQNLLCILILIGVVLWMILKVLQDIVLVLAQTFFSWCSKKQEIVAKSITEAEFIAATAAVNQVLWLKKKLTDLNMEQKESTKSLCWQSSCNSYFPEFCFSWKTKHFNIKLFFLREVQKDGVVDLVYCKIEDQIADLFTKPLPVNKFEFLR